jgi:GntR family transcriptional repressor for pyruvate dehydrogenase complex
VFFRPPERRRVSADVADQIRQAILEKSIEAGDRLPGERELAQRFNVNRSTVREALRLLEEEGFVETKQGHGTRALDALKNAGLGLLPYLLAPAGKRLDASTLRDLLELRVELNGWAARLAAERGDAKELPEVKAALEAIEKAGKDAEKLQLADFDFFQAIVRMGENRVLILMMNAVRPAYLSIRSKFISIYEGFDPSAHRKLVQALEKRDAAAAERLARKIMELPLQRKSDA